MIDIQFDCLETLPSNVRAALDEKEQKQWMNSFNSIVRKSKGKQGYRDTVLKAWQTLSGSQGCRFFSGFVSTEDLDRQNDVVLSEMALEKINKHIDRGGTMIDTHTNRTVGSFIHADIRKSPSGKPGIYAHGVIYKGEPYYDTVWEQIKKGVECPTCKDVRKGFSIGGFAIDVSNSCDAFGCHRDITDMSIHEISVCQDPANSAAMIYEVNTVAKSEEEMENMNNEINKAIREDSPAEDVVETPSPVQDESVVEAQVPQDGMVQSGENEIKTIIDKIKTMSKEYKDMIKLREALNVAIAEMNAGGMMGAEQQAVIKAVLGSPAVDTEAHQLVSDKKDCKCPKELYGDVKDPQVKDTMESLSNVDIEADPSAKKDHGELMPGKMENMPKTEKGPAGPSVETKVMEGFSKLKPKNASIEIPVEHLEEDKGDAEEIKDASNKIEDKADNIIEEDEEELEDVEKACGCAKRMTAEQFVFKYGPKEHKESFNDKGDNREKNMGKEGKELMQKAEIPDELYPMFQEFLKEKGIKLEPDVKSPEIEEVMEKTMYVDDGVSEMDLKEMTNPLKFDSYVAIGKTEIQKMKIKNLHAKMRLAKSLEVVDLSFLVPELRKVKDAQGNDVDLPNPPAPGPRMPQEELDNLLESMGRHDYDDEDKQIAYKKHRIRPPRRLEQRKMPMSPEFIEPTVEKTWKEFKKVKDEEGKEIDLPEAVPANPRRKTNPKTGELKLVKDPKTGKMKPERNAPVAQREHEALVLDTEGDVKDEMGMVEPTREYRGRQLNEEGLAEVDHRMEENVVGECPMCGEDLYYDKSQSGDDVVYCPSCNYHLDTFKALGKAWKEFKKFRAIDAQGNPIKGPSNEELDIPSPSADNKSLLRDKNEMLIHDEKGNLVNNPFYDTSQYPRPKQRGLPRAKKEVSSFKEEINDEMFRLPNDVVGYLMEHPGKEEFVSNRLKRFQTEKPCPRCGGATYSNYPEEEDPDVYCPSCNYTNVKHMGTPGAVKKKPVARSDYLKGKRQ